MLHPVLLLALAATNDTGIFPPFPVGIIGWIVCNSRKRSAFGGWLLFFYWQLYSGVLLTTYFFYLRFESYVPENFEYSGRYWWFVAANVPTVLLFLLQVAVGTILIGVPTWGLLKLLRWTNTAQVAATSASTLITYKFFPTSFPLVVMVTLVPQVFWMIYFFRSKRVKHVFQLHDWDTAVESIYPAEATLSIR